MTELQYKKPPFDHQRKAIEIARPLPAYGLLFEMGAMKTFTAINIVRQRCNDKGKNLRTIIFGPGIVVPNWKREWLEYSYIEPKNVVMVDGTGKERLEIFKKGIERGANVFITSFSTLLMKEVMEAFRKHNPEIIIIDESHRLKNRKALSSKSMLGLTACRSLILKLILTGSPVLNKQYDLFQQVAYLFGGFPTLPFFDLYQGTPAQRVEAYTKHLITSHFNFVRRYFVDKNAGMPKDVYFPRWEVLPSAEKEISAILSKFSMRVTKEECLDLPPEVTVDVPVKLKPEQRKAYESMRKQFVAHLDSGVAVAKVSLTKALRLLQITSGFVSVEGANGEELDEPIHRFDDTPREEALRELLTELRSTGKVLIWAVWKENYATIRRVCDELSIKYVECHGEISDAQKKKNIDSFNTDDSIGVYIGHPGSGGIGINLVTACFSIRYSRTASLEQWLQSRARNHRGGQTKKVTHYEIFAEGTFDEIQKNVLAQKLQMSERLLQEIKQKL